MLTSIRSTDHAGPGNIVEKIICDIINEVVPKEDNVIVCIVEEEKFEFCYIDISACGSWG